MSFGPPPLPVYAQPMCPGPGYIWTPGYWAWDPTGGWFWVPGTWVLAPFRGALWTPGYWGWDPDRAVFLWHGGYWGLSVGFYGGIDYGFGYPGHGYYGGFWRDNDFYYNRDVDRINIFNIHHVYSRRAPRFYRGRVSYNGGEGGINARPDRRDFMARRDRRMGPSHWQDRQERMARGMREMRWSENHGRPRIAATPRPERFGSRGVQRAYRSGGAYRFQRQADQHRFQNRDWHSFRGQPARQNGGNFRSQRQRNYRNASQQRYPQQRYGQRHKQGDWRQFNRPAGRQNQRGSRATQQQRYQPQQRYQQPRYQPRYQQSRQQRGNNYRQMRQRQGGNNHQRQMRPQQRGGHQRRSNNRGQTDNSHGHHR